MIFKLKMCELIYKSEDWIKEFGKPADTQIRSLGLDLGTKLKKYILSCSQGLQGKITNWSCR